MLTYLSISRWKAGKSCMQFLICGSYIARSSPAHQIACLQRPLPPRTQLGTVQDLRMSTESCYIGLPSNSQKHQGSHTSGTLSVCSSYGLHILLQYSIIVMFFLFKTIGKKPCYFFVLHHSWKHLDSVRPRQHLHFQPPVFPLWRHG